MTDSNEQKHYMDRSGIDGYLFQALLNSIDTEALVMHINKDKTHPYSIVVLDGKWMVFEPDKWTYKPHSTFRYAVLVLIAREDINRFHRKIHHLIVDVTITVLF